MRAKLKRLDLVIRDLIWKIRIAFQTFKEKLGEAVFRRSERDAKRIGQEMAVKDRVGIENKELDIRNDDELIYDMRYKIKDQIHERLPESQWLRYQIRKETELSNIRIRDAKERQVVNVRILKSDIEKLKSENKKLNLLLRADLSNELRRETDNYNLKIRQLNDQLHDSNISSEEKANIQTEKDQLIANHQAYVETMKQKQKDAKHADIPDLIEEIAVCEKELVDSKARLEEFIKNEKSQLEITLAPINERLAEIKADPSLEKGPINPNPEPERPAPTIDKKYQKVDEKARIDEIKVTIKALEAEFKETNRKLHDKERAVQDTARMQKDAFVKEYVENKIKDLVLELAKKEKELASATEENKKSLQSEVKALNKQIKRRSYVESLEGEHQHQQKTTETLRLETKELRKQQKEISDQLVLNNRKIREINDGAFYAEKAHKVEYYTQLYQSKSDKEVLKMIPPTRRQAEKTARVNENIKNWLKASLYLLPALLLLGIFTFYPIVNSFIVSFYEGYNIQTGEIDGYTLLGNYQTVLAHANFKQAVLNTGVIVFISVPITIIVGLMIAVALNAIKPLKGFFQTVFFLPYVTNTIAIGLVFAYIFAGNRTTIDAGQISGLANQIIKFFGGKPQPWLSIGATYWTAMGVILIYSLWNGLAFKIIVFLAGIQGIDKQYYQASQIDGASKLTQFRKITVPLLSPMILYILITSIIGAFKTYTSVVAIIGPTGTITAGAHGAVNLKTIVFYIYDYIGMAGQNGMMSLASAAAIILFIIILVFTGIQMLASRRRVHY